MSLRASGMKVTIRSLPFQTLVATSMSSSPRFVASCNTLSPPPLEVKVFSGSGLSSVAVGACCVALTFDCTPQMTEQQIAPDCESCWAAELADTSTSRPDSWHSSSGARAAVHRAASGNRGNLCELHRCVPAAIRRASGALLFLTALPSASEPSCSVRGARKRLLDMTSVALARAFRSATGTSLGEIRESVTSEQGLRLTTLLTACVLQLWTWRSPKLLAPGWGLCERVGSAP
jgi:hypothetical protein